MVKRLLTVLLVLAMLVLCGTVVLAQHQAAAEPRPPASGEVLWQSLPPELLANVAEGKMEAIASYKSAIRRLEAELARVQEIEKAKLAESRPPPEE